MTQATTPTFVITLPSDINLGDAEHVVFTMEQYGYTISKNESDMSISSNVVTIKLSQEDTIGFDYRHQVRIQLNWTYSDGSRAATKTKTISVDENLYKDVIE